jgi:uncharacterized protein (TIGR02118 family)
MIKLIALLKRKPGMSREEFKRRWLFEHTKLSSIMPGLIQYRINVATEEQPDGVGAEPLFDGSAELWWESLEAMKACFKAESSQLAGADADLFCSERIHLFTEEFLVVENGVPIQPPKPLS